MIIIQCINRNVNIFQAKNEYYLQVLLCLAVAVGSAPITDNELQTRLVAIKDVRNG